MENEKLTAVTNKICELLKGSELDPKIKHYGQIVGMCSIREAEILAATNKIKHVDTFIDSSGFFYAINSNPHAENNEIWQLGKPLSDQPQEVIEFLFNILNCE